MIRRHGFVTHAAFLACVLASGSAVAQIGPGNTGPLSPPQAYGDGHGTRGLGDRPIHFPGPGARIPDPVRYWQGRIIGTPYYNGTVIVVVNGGSPCYVPWYYSPFDFAGFYNGYQAGMSMGFGNMQMGFQMGGYGGYGYGGFAQNNNPPAQYQPSQMQRTQPPAASRRGSSNDDEDYYLNRKPGPSTPTQRDAPLAQAITDITNAYKQGDITLLEKHVAPGDTLTLQSKGRTRKSLAAQQYLEMTRDALKVMKTLRYDLNHVEPASNGAWMVYGTHTIRGEDGTERSFTVGFVLQKRDDAYFITEVSAEPAQ